MNDEMTAKKGTVALGSDHAGFALKEEIEKALIAEGYDVHDLGTHTEESMDYPDIAREVGEAVAGGKYGRGILVCGTGVGVCMAANKVPGIRAGSVSDTYSAQMARQHNDANVICIGARVVGLGLALEIVKTFLNTGFEGGRHARRVDKINDMDNGK